jgi:hypothetical protein
LDELRHGRQLIKKRPQMDIHRLTNVVVGDHVGFPYGSVNTEIFS